MGGPGHLAPGRITWPSTNPDSYCAMRGETGGLENQQGSNSDPLLQTAGQRTHPGPCSLNAKRGGKLTILENTGFTMVKHKAINGLCLVFN